MSGNVESVVLAKAMEALGGIGARWVSRVLPAVPYEATLDLNEGVEHLKQRVAVLVGHLGTPVAELPSHPEQGAFTLLVGSGHGNLNPTLIHIQLEAIES